MTSAKFPSIFDPRSLCSVPKSTPAHSSYSMSSQYSSIHMLSLHRVYSRVLGKHGFRQRRDGSSLDFALRCTDSQVFCDVCSDCIDVENLVVCSLCRAVVHRSCYGGLLLIKDSWNQWLCDQCLTSGLLERPPSLIPCHLCDRKYGALKYVRKLGWVHPGCVLYIELLEFKDQSHSSVLRLATPTQPSLCKYCQKPSQWTAHCAYPNCELSFHVRCAQMAGLRPCLKASLTHLYCKPHRAVVAGASDPLAREVRKQFNLYRTIQTNARVDVCEKTNFPMELRPFSAPKLAVTAISQGNVAKRRTNPKKRRPKFQKSNSLMIESKRPISYSVPVFEEQRVLSEELSKVTGINKSGTIKELENKLKAFLRQNKKQDDYNFYDVSHIPELAELLGNGGKVEHRLLPSVVLQHSFIINA